MEEDGESEDWENKQRLKAAVHYTVGNVCSQLKDTTFSREVVAIITETTFKQAELLATDLELFAKHAKRTTVSVEDVKLCSRRSASLLDFINTQSEQLRAAKEGGKEGGGGGKEGEEEGDAAATTEGDQDGNPRKGRAKKKKDN